MKGLKLIWLCSIFCNHRPNVGLHEERISIYLLLKHRLEGAVILSGPEVLKFLVSELLAILQITEDAKIIFVNVNNTY